MSIGDAPPVVVPHKHLAKVMHQGLDGVPAPKMARQLHPFERQWSSETACFIDVSLADAKTVRIRAMQSASVCMRHWLCSFEKDGSGEQTLVDTIINAANALPHDSFFHAEGELSCNLEIEGAKRAQMKERTLLVSREALGAGLGTDLKKDLGEDGPLDKRTMTTRDGAEEDAPTFKWPEDRFCKRKMKKNKDKNKKRRNSSSSEHKCIQKLRKKTTPGVFSWKHRDQTMCTEGFNFYHPLSRY